METHREREMTPDLCPEPGVGKLAQLLARREGRKRARAEGEMRLKNSREFAAVRPASETGSAGMEGERQGANSDRVLLSESGSGGDGWERLAELAKTATLNCKPNHSLTHHNYMPCIYHVSCSCPTY